MIDPRGHRFGAGVSAVILIVAAITGTPWLVALVLLSIGVSAAFGLRYSIYGIVWRRIVAAPGLGKVEPEHEYPPRFAQVLGSTALTLALIAFLLGATTLGWVFTLAVAALQSAARRDRLLPGLPAVLPALVGAGPRDPHLDPRPRAPPLLRHRGDPVLLTTCAAGRSTRCRRFPRDARALTTSRRAARPAAVASHATREP